jgi:hypothetical protein
VTTFTWAIAAWPKPSGALQVAVGEWREHVRHGIAQVHAFGFNLLEAPVEEVLRFLDQALDFALQLGRAVLHVRIYIAGRHVRDELVEAVLDFLQIVFAIVIEIHVSFSGFWWCGIALSVCRFTRTHRPKGQRAATRRGA